MRLSVEEILEIPLSNDEEYALHNSAAQMKEAIASLDLSREPVCSA